MRQAAHDAVRERLESVAGQFADLFSQSIAPRYAETRDAAADPAVASYLEDRSAEAEAQQALEELRASSPQVISVALVDPSGQQVLRAPPGPATEAALPPWVRPDSASLSPFQATGDSVWQEVAAPVLVDGDDAGYVIQRRRLTSSAEGSRILGGLIGQDAGLLIGNQAGDLWTDLSDIVDGPDQAELQVPSPIAYSSATRGRRLGAAAEVAGTPWVVLVEFPEAAVMARPAAFLASASAIALVLVLLGGFIGWLISRRITDPLLQMNDALAAFAAGRGDVTLPEDAVGEIGALARVSADMIEKLSERERTLKATSGRIATSAAEILAATTQQASAETEAWAAVAETMTTVEQVNQTASHARERAEAVAKTADRAAEIGKAGQDAVEESITAMSMMREQMESIAERIVALAEQAQAIGDITAALNDIAEQTNLLALNAAVEAARAGEHGRGFAVVAGEVKALAEQSKKATVEVRRILGDIQRASGSAVMTAEQGNRRVAATAEQVTRAGKTIQTLVEGVTDAARATHQIVASAGQQSAGLEQIRQSMDSIQRATQQNLSATRQAERAAHDLNELGGELLSLLGQTNGKPTH